METIDPIQYTNTFVNTFMQFRLTLSNASPPNALPIYKDVKNNQIHKRNIENLI